MLDINRRSVLKSIGAGSTLGAVSAVSGVAATDSYEVESDEPELPYPDVEYRTVGEDLREAMGPWYWLLTIDKGRLEELLDLSRVDDDRTAELAENLDVVRDHYEIDRVRDGNEVIYTLADPDIEVASVGGSQGSDKVRNPPNELNAGKGSRSDAGPNFDDHPHSRLPSTARAVFDGFTAEDGDGRDQVSTAWTPNNHESMTHVALDVFDISDSAKDVIADSSREPDEFGCEQCSVDWLPGSGYVPGFIVEAIGGVLATFTDSHKHEPYHFYWPDPPSLDLYIYEIDISAFGGAPGEAQYMMDQAESSSLNQNEYLGYALHYVQDMGVPLHTGAIWEQVNPDPQGCGFTGCDQYFDPQYELHFAYEDWVWDNFEEADWYLDEPFKDSFGGRGYRYFTHDNAVERHCENLAEFTTQYSTLIFEELLETGISAPSRWDDDVYRATHNCLAQTGSHTRGVIDQLYDFE